MEERIKKFIKENPVGKTPIDKYLSNQIHLNSQLLIMIIEHLDKKNENF